MQDNEGLAGIRKAGMGLRPGIDPHHSPDFEGAFSSHRRGRKIVSGIRDWMEGQQIWTGSATVRAAYIDATISVHDED